MTELDELIKELRYVGTVVPMTHSNYLRVKAAIDYLCRLQIDPTAQQREETK